MKEDIKEFRKTRDFLICIDSDGCVMDTMDVKHMRCFGPCLVYEWDLGEYREEIIRLWRKVNLLSVSRGVNRFQGLAQVLKNIHENYTQVEGLEGYIRWAESAQELSDKSLEDAFEKTEIIETANEMSREISKGTKEYADSLLGTTEDVMKETLEKLETNMSEALKLMEISLQDTIKTIQNSRKELK